MLPETYEWVKSGHVIGVILWIGGLFSVYWMLRMHAHAPKDMHEKLTLMERSLALVMDLAATLAIGCGLAMALLHGGTHPTSTLFTAHGAGWFHIKLTVVVFGVLSVHGVVRARLGKFSRGKISAMPSWPWTLLVVSVMAIVILVFRVRYAMESAPSSSAPPPALTAPAAH